MELIPFSQQGAVYPMFNKKIHVIPQDKVPDNGTDYVALDFGFTEGHPMAAAFIRITNDDIWYQYDEIYQVRLQIEDLVQEILAKMGGKRLTGIVADSARPDLVDYMASKGLPMIPSPKSGGDESRIVSGIALLRKRLRPKIQIMGEPKPNYYITSNCKKSIYEWVHYRYKEIKINRPLSEKPEKNNDNIMDALRYLELFFKFGHPKDDKAPKSSVVKEFNEFGML
jgi:phage terminase large subunit